MSEGRKYTKSEADADASTNDEQNERGPMRLKVCAANRKNCDKQRIRSGQTRQRKAQEMHAQRKIYQNPTCLR